MDTPEGQRNLMQRAFGRLLHGYFLITRGLTLGVRVIVLTDDNRVLLVRHTYTPGWHFPGGGVERGETTEVAVGRELYQETGLKILGRPVFHGAFYNKRVSNRDHVLAYQCKVENEQALKVNCREIAEVGFFDASDLPDGTDPGTIRRLKEISSNSIADTNW